MHLNLIIDLISVVLYLILHWQYISSIFLCYILKLCHFKFTSETNLTELIVILVITNYLL